MFTGLIQETAKIKSALARDGGVSLALARPAPWNDLSAGESIAVDGVCLTLTGFDADSMEFFVGGETIAVTTLGEKKSGAVVNLERSLRLGDRLGGHMVTGHADGRAKVIKAERSGACFLLRFQVSPKQFKWIVPKGSIAINGVSLTVNMVERDPHTVDVLLIPETLARTNLGGLRAGDDVNVECDQTVKIIAHVTDPRNSMTGVHRIGDDHEHHS